MIGLGRFKPSTLDIVNHEVKSASKCFSFPNVRARLKLGAFQNVSIGESAKSQQIFAVTLLTQSGHFDPTGGTGSNFTVRAWQ